jgi:hypothetical protein
MDLVSLFAPIWKQVLGSPGASQQSAAIQREPQSQEPKPTTHLEQVNAAVVSQQELKQLNAPEQITTASSTAAITPEIIPNQTTLLAATNQQEIKPPAIKLEFSEEAVKSLKPIFSALTDLVKSFLPELSLKELAATAKPVLQALSQAHNQAETLWQKENPVRKLPEQLGV